MLHMLSCFNLKDGISIEQFEQGNSAFLQHMQQQGLVESFGPVGRRVHHPVMDTDAERDHSYFYVMSFIDRAQCDKAVDCIYGQTEPAESAHQAVSMKVADPVFICWEDI